MSDNYKRGAGVLCHISSLPNKYGIGSLGKEAYEFADILKKSHVKYWQVLPVPQTDCLNSYIARFSLRLYASGKQSNVSPNLSLRDIILAGSSRPANGLRRQSLPVGVLQFWQSVFYRSGKSVI